MNTYRETFNTWEKVAAAYEMKFMNFDLYNDTYDKLIDLIPNKNASILDIGCGPGNVTKYLLSKNPGYQIRGIDVSENMIKLASKNGPQAQFEVMDCREIDKINEKYEALICGFCIPYLSSLDCSKLFMSCKQLLTESGVLYLSFVAGPYDKSGFILGSSGDRAYFYYHPVDTLLEKLSAASFKLFETFERVYDKSDGSSEKHTIFLLTRESL